MSETMPMAGELSDEEIGEIWHAHYGDPFKSTPAVSEMRSHINFARRVIAAERKRLAERLRALAKECRESSPAVDTRRIWSSVALEDAARIIEGL